ncbi:hypothetical protein GCM10027570_27840 [Streptomonospora sediminis]
MAELPVNRNGKLDRAALPVVRVAALGRLAGWWCGPSHQSAPARGRTGTRSPTGYASATVRRIAGRSFLRRATSVNPAS